MRDWESGSTARERFAGVYIAAKRIGLLLAFLLALGAAKPAEAWCGGWGSPYGSYYDIWSFEGYLGYLFGYECWVHPEALYIAVPDEYTAPPQQPEADGLCRPNTDYDIVYAAERIEELEKSIADARSENEVDQRWVADSQKAMIEIGEGGYGGPGVSATSSLGYTYIILTRQANIREREKAIVAWEEQIACFERALYGPDPPTVTPDYPDFPGDLIQFSFDFF